MRDRLKQTAWNWTWLLPSLPRRRTVTMGGTGPGNAGALIHEQQSLGVPWKWTACNQRRLFVCMCEQCMYMLGGGKACGAVLHGNVEGICWLWGKPLTERQSNGCILKEVESSQARTFSRAPFYLNALQWHSREITTPQMSALSNLHSYSLWCLHLFIQQTLLCKAAHKWVW